MHKYEFKKTSNRSLGLLICPECSEVLHRLDIETYKYCPYCNFKLENNMDIEDYLLQPAIDRWTSIQQFSIGSFFSSLSLHLESENDKLFF